jgi:hypothetical protein
MHQILFHEYFLQEFIFPPNTGRRISRKTSAVLSIHVTHPEALSVRTRGRTSEGKKKKSPRPRLCLEWGKGFRGEGEWTTKTQRHEEPQRGWKISGINPDNPSIPAILIQTLNFTLTPGPSPIPYVMGEGRRADYTHSPSGRGHEKKSPLLRAREGI